MKHLILAVALQSLTSLALAQNADCDGTHAPIIRYDTTSFTNAAGSATEVQFSLLTENAPIGAEISFETSPLTTSGDELKLVAIVPRPIDGGRNGVNARFGMFTTAIVAAGEKVDFRYQIKTCAQRFSSLFKMEMSASVIRPVGLVD